MRAAALLALLIVLQVTGVGSAAATPPGPVAVPQGPIDGQSRLVVDVPGAGGRGMPPGSFSVTVAGVPQPAGIVPLMSERSAMSLVVDASDDGGAVLQPGLSGIVDFLLAAPPATRSALVADTTPPAVVRPLRPGPADTLRGLSVLQPRGDRQTVAAIDLAVQELPLETGAPRLVVLYTAASDAVGLSSTDLGARLAAAGVVLAVVSTAADGGPLPRYWSEAAAATGGVAVGARGPDAVDAFARLADALRTRYLVTFPEPDRFPVPAAVRVDTPDGPVSADTELSAPPTPPGGPAADGGTRSVGLAPALAVAALLLIGVLAARARARRRGARPEPTVADAAWNVPAPSEPVVHRAELLAELDRTVRAGGPVVLCADDGRAGLGTTTAMIEFVHRNRREYDIAWWIPAEDPPLVADRMAQLAETLGIAALTDTAEEATERLLEALRRRRRWLLIFDDAEDPHGLARFLPAGPGHVLVGSTDREWREHGRSVSVRPFGRAESVGLLRARSPGLTAGEADRIAAALDDVPLAVDPAGATLADTGMSVDDYLRRLSEVRAREADAASCPAWAVAFDRLAADDPAALALLTIVAWLAPQPVPLTLLTQHAELLPDPLAGIAQNPSALAGHAATLRRRALARVGPEGVALHRAPAAQLRSRTRRPGDGGWAASAVRVVRAAVPEDPADPAGRRAWRQLLPHVLAVTDPVRDLDEVVVEVGWLLHHAGRYLRSRGEPRFARALFEDAHGLYRRRLGDDHPDTVTAARALADDLHALGQHEQARRVLGDTRTVT